MKNISWIYSEPYKRIRYYFGTIIWGNKSFLFRSNLDNIPRKKFQFNWEQISTLEYKIFPINTKLLGKNIVNIRVVEIHIKETEQIIRIACQGSFLKRNFADIPYEKFDSIRTKKLFEYLQDPFHSRQKAVGSISKKEMINKNYSSSYTQKEKLERLKRLLQKSSKISLSMIQNYLEMVKHEFDKLILTWAIDFNFTIDGEFLVAQPDSLDLIMLNLDTVFEEWDLHSHQKEGKI
jgi:hypothetical protein